MLFHGRAAFYFRGLRDLPRECASRCRRMSMLSSARKCIISKQPVGSPEQGFWQPLKEAAAIVAHIVAKSLFDGWMPEGLGKVGWNSCPTSNWNRKVICATNIQTLAYALRHPIGIIHRFPSFR